MSPSSSRLDCSTDDGNNFRNKANVNFGPYSHTDKEVPLMPISATSNQETAAVLPIRQHDAPDRQSVLRLEAGENVPNLSIHYPRTVIKLTPWRLINTIFLLAVGTGKAVAAYQGYSTLPNTMDWIIGVAWALISYWCSVLEIESPNVLSWLLEFDLLAKYGFYKLIRPLLALCAFYVLLSCHFSVVERVYVWLDGQLTLTGIFLLVVVMMLLAISMAGVVVLVPRFLNKFRVFERLFKYISLPAQIPPLFSPKDWVVGWPKGPRGWCCLCLVVGVVYAAIFYLFLSGDSFKIVFIPLYMMASLGCGAIVFYTSFGLTRMAIRIFKRLNGQHDARSNTTAAAVDGDCDVV